MIEIKNRYTAQDIKVFSQPYLLGSNCEEIREDFFRVLKCAPNELEGLKQALLEGKIDGSCYHGECCCLVGTIVKLQSINHNEVPRLYPNPNRLTERWFIGIGPGDTPENNPIVKVTLEWIEEFQQLVKETSNA